MTVGGLYFLPLGNAFINEYAPKQLWYTFRNMAICNFLHRPLGMDHYIFLEDFRSLRLIKLVRRYNPCVRFYDAGI